MSVTQETGSAHRSAISSILQSNEIDSAIVGSTYINGFGNDVDVLVRVCGREKAVLDLIHAGFAVEGNPGSYEPGDGEFESLRRGDTNALITEDAEFYEKWVRAAEVCKYVHGLLPQGINRDGRVHIHQLIMD